MSEVRSIAAGSPATAHPAPSFNMDMYLLNLEFDCIAAGMDDESGYLITSHTDNFNIVAKTIHSANVAAGWWTDLKTGLPLQRNVPELLCLAHSEISEALEGHRKGLMDDHLPHRPMIEVEIADTFIRLFDLAGALELDLGGAIAEKLLYNSSRADHKIANRAKEGGKKL